MTSVVMFHLAVALTIGVASYTARPATANGQAEDTKPLRQISMPVTGDWHALGAASAPLTLVEFTDYECPLCRAFHDETFARLKTKYIETGKLRFVSRDQPLPEHHPHAMDAAHAARCAGDHGKFWEMRDALIAHSDSLSRADILEYAGRLQLDSEEFRSCLAAKKYQAEIDKDIADAVSLNLRGTPTFVLGKPSEKSIDGVVIVGALPFGVFETAIERMLKASSR
jgi:protein-disulfide isomerase